MWIYQNKSIKIKYTSVLNEEFQTKIALSVGLPWNNVRKLSPKVYVIMKFEILSYFNSTICSYPKDSDGLGGKIFHLNGKVAGAVNNNLNFSRLPQNSRNI